RYAVVLANPPYITVKDPELRARYRRLYPDSTAGKYALSAPFLERCFELARAGGFVGQITANSFTRRRFGKPLIERVLNRVDLRRVVNAEGAYIPGHGTPTILLFGRNQPPASASVHAILARRGEPSVPRDPARGHVWTSIAARGDELGYEDDFITVEALPRAALARHPWSLRGGCARAL
ncbi:MAG: hypothetical protein KDG55_24480, partial [Rhodocyclaceae bacterium]|nr:hypothetical protein [Rhodocyclaceae bacterium]